jgi:PHP family Zn ribbon phosphoesterase
LQQQYNDLSAKMRSQTIIPEEHQDLLKLIDIVEKSDGDRLHHLIQLSQLRNISLAELMEQLQIYPQSVCF